jgi:hypothetical protein
MGLVYRAYDSIIRREVAVKTIRDIPEPAALQLFQKECDVLASMSHPNIVEIFDIGEFEEDGKRKPYFVMPLLPGTTLDNLIRQASHRLTVERTVQIFTQTCRGLQAAHERGLVHRDLKPSNIFVMEDDSVKIIDFGVAHITDAHSTIGQKGTLAYMSPEQIQMKPLSALSDIFSLSVVCYEVLTGRQPFRRANADQIVEAILRQMPPPASELNAAVNQAISRVVHKGMAKQPWHRFSTARDFAESLNKALRNEPIEFFDPARIRPRLERANRAFEEGDYQFAGEILGELQAEGHLDTGIGLLQQQIDRAVRQKTITQLLASARARFEEQEDPLALQKIQEILQLETDNAAALGLKAKIENRRSERQIESWYKLAAQHIENHAYPHAREALQNVLQLRPKEARAAQLLAEVDRHEQEYNRLRQEKAQLHRAAMEAYQKGEVSTALTKLALVLELDRQAPDPSNPERSTTYQSLYNKVRSEHDAMNNAYAEARKHLADRAFAKALALCDNYLAKYPNNALFQALKFDIEEQQRQELSAFIAAIDHRVESEPDLDKRVHILKEALEQQPGETHFQRALRLTEDKRDLVNSIIARAHLHEEQNLFSEALSDWEILRTIYSQYPGLKFEVERIQKRREQQSRSEARSRWVDQIDACVRSCEFARALDLVQRAEAEFPDDEEISELRRVATDNAQRADQAQALMTEGQDLCGQSRFTEGIALLRRAHALVERSPVASSVLANALLEQAQSMMDQDAAGAEAIVQEATALNPGNPLAKSLRSTLLDRRKEQFVGECVSQARRYHAAGDVARALASVEEGVAKYPHETRLLQVREGLSRELEQAQLRQVRVRDLEQMRRLQVELERTSDPSAGRRIGDRMVALGAKYPNDPEFEAALAEVHRRAVERPQTASLAVDSTDQQNATRMFSPSAPGAVDRGPASPSSPAASVAGRGTPQPLRPPDMPTKIAPGPRPVPELSRLRSLAARGLKSIRALGQKLSALSEKIKVPDVAGLGNLSRDVRKKLLLASGVLGTLIIVFVLVLAVTKIVQPRHRRVPALVVGKGAVAIQTDPPGASIKINGADSGVSNLELQLPTGTYQVEAQLSGYQPAATELELQEGSRREVRLTLLPALPLIRLFADSGTGKVTFDDQPEVDLEGGQWTREGIVPGAHKLKFSGAQGSLNLSFESVAGAPFKLTRPIASPEVHAVVVGNSLEHTQVFSSFTPAKLSLDGQAEMDIGADGVELPAMSRGPHSLALRRANDQHTVELEIGAVPTLTLFLGSDLNVASLLVVTGEDKAQVFLDGQLYKRQTKAGQLMITNLSPKKYAVRVAKNGFQDVAEESVTLKKGQQSRLTFKLVALPKLATLSIQGGAPGTEVRVDQESIGHVQDDGSFHAASILPGDHVVELRKEGFNPKQIKEHFTAGATVSLGGAEATLEIAKGTLRVTFTPPDASVTLTRAGEPAIRITSGNTVSVAPGTYTLTAITADHTQNTVVQVVAGQLKTLDLSLAPGDMTNWEIPGGWRPDGGVFIRKGGGLVLYKTSPTSGTFVFSVMLRKGHRLQWVLNCKDDKNYLLFQTDEESLSRSVVNSGEATEAARIPYRSDRKRFRTFQVRISTGEIVTQVLEGQNWKVLDRVVMPGVDLSSGKFGFLIPGSDELALSNFRHYAEEGAR